MKNFLHACYNGGMSKTRAINEFNGVWEKAAAKGFVQEKRTTLEDARSMTSEPYNESIELYLTEAGRIALIAQD